MELDRYTKEMIILFLINQKIINNNVEESNMRLKVDKFSNELTRIRVNKPFKTK